MPKRTYSRRNMSMKPDDKDKGDMERWKRQKKDENPSLPSDARMRLNDNKKKLRRPFGGPISILDGETGLGEVELPKPKGLIDRSLANKCHERDRRTLTKPHENVKRLTPNSAMHSLYGGDLKAFLSEQKQRQETKNRLQNRELSSHGSRSEKDMNVKCPQPQLSAKKAKEKAMAADSNGAPQRRLARPLSASECTTTTVADKDTHEFGQVRIPRKPSNPKRSFHSEQFRGSQGSPLSHQKSPYIPRSNEVKILSLPSRDILKRTLDSESSEAKLWYVNQTQSPLLRLPKDIRTKIFEHVFEEGRTIHIGLDAFISEKDRKENPHCKPGYWRKAYSGHLYLASEKRYPADRKVPISFLNRVCRQMYRETRLLPYKYDTLSFDSSLVMNAFLLLDQKLAHAHDEIQSIVVGPGPPEELPQPNLLKYLGGLVVAVRRVSWGVEYYQVVRGETGPRLKTMRI
ncbi:uncharacterized protein EI97DRAFT_84159 [Westerdykella ornata]|uniref:DUF7730 domain-containing protein n=1 Tax=Westerdykella ornata TaxID=318751 RepID=A0A6A6JFE4_WESOR|nr:uncharacterized protein EI97DRAFT_84159 [Westerdykella ornata]KAF2274995.1 hypothetical protein EI97DRAFT_84159 [Westerdykella ornata]